MRSAAAVALVILLSPFAFSQTSDSNHSGALPSVSVTTSAPQVQPPAVQPAQPPSYANYSIMLVNPVANSGGVVLMHTPKNSLEYVDVKQIQTALNNGYVPVRSAEIIDAINYLHAEIDRLTAENARLKGLPATPAPVVVIEPQSQPAAPSQAQIEAARRAEAAARRQQIIQSFMMMQNANRPQTQNLNVNVTDCTRYPALCVGR
jgi:hypothetical protein